MVISFLQCRFSANYNKFNIPLKEGYVFVCTVTVLMLERKRNNEINLQTTNKLSLANCTYYNINSRLL